MPENGNDAVRMTDRPETLYDTDGVYHIPFDSSDYMAATLIECYDMRTRS